MKFRHPFKIKEKHYPDLLRLMLYFRQSAHCAGDSPQYFHLTRLKKMTEKRAHHPLVMIAANIWFNRETRGCNAHGLVSRWRRRDDLHVNSQIEKLLGQLYMDNAEAITETWEIAGQKDEVEVVVRTKLKFKDEDVAALVKELLSTVKEVEE